MTTSYLVDSHIWLWMLEDSPRLGPASRAVIADTSNDLALSMASVWELAIKTSLGKLRSPLGTDEGLRAALRVSGVTLLPIESADALRSAALPHHHRDPFDRMIIAQAQRLGIPIITTDESFRTYGVEIITG